MAEYLGNENDLFDLQNLSNKERLLAHEKFLEYVKKIHKGFTLAVRECNESKKTQNSFLAALDFCRKP